MSWCFGALLVVGVLWTGVNAGVMIEIGSIGN
jgi:hypothetical protein